MRKILQYAATVFVLVALTTGCAVNRATATVDPSARLDRLKTLHVRQAPDDDRRIDKLIAEKLRTLGYDATTGAEAPKAIDALVTYVDKWFWDITMYMVELTIVIREPATEFPLATGNSLHTSLTRKSPPEMVDEVITNIISQGKTK